MARHDRFGDEIIACRICGEDTTMLGTKLCNGCWEVDARIDDFIRGANTKYLKALADKIGAKLKERA